MDINRNMSPEQYNQANALISSFSDVFCDKPGFTNLLKHGIKLNTHTPLRCKSRHIPYAMMETVCTKVDNMVDLNAIESSESQFSSPIVIVKRKDGSNRFCIDFRVLNCHTEFDAEPMPDTDEIFSKLATHKYFSSLDLAKGYWQVPLTDDSKPMTAFQTPKGLYQFRVMPFGLVTAAATFSRLMRLLTHGMTNVDNFIDYIIIYTQSFQDHLSVLRQLFLELCAANLTAKPRKCSLFYLRNQMLRSHSWQ